MTRRRKVYIFAQVLGGIVGAAVVYANYFHAIDIVEGSNGVRTLATAGLFSTYAVSDFPFQLVQYFCVIVNLVGLYDECLCIF
jgi:glycerol uptake facilitator-like aquaporin